MPKVGLKALLVRTMTQMKKRTKKKHEADLDLID
jgi:hypothetical protein